MTQQPGAGQPQEQPGYEQAREELVDVVRRLESGGTTLEELARICQGWLEGAKQRLDAALSEREQPPR